MKSCNKCGLKKPLDAFQKRRQNKDGYAAVCRSCDSAIRIQRKIDQGKRLPDPPPGTKHCGKCEYIKPLTEFYTRKSGPHEGKPYAYCMDCIKDANTARARARGVQPVQPAHPDAPWRRRMLTYYKMTAEDYEARLAAQNGECFGCGKRASVAGRRFAVDHDHTCCPGNVSCGKCIRGLLCYSCNFVVGHAYDNPETLDRLATYLREYDAS